MTRPPPVDDRSLVSARLLIDLVTNTLDPGYEAAARRRDPDTPEPWYGRWAVALGCALIGFLLVVAYVHTHRGAPEAAKVHDRLVTRVRDAQHGADGLATTLAGLETKVDALRNEALPQSGALTQELDRDLAAAAETAVRGPGVTVTLGEPKAASAGASSGRGGATPIGAANILTDRDVRSVVNELWHDGAEAIAVNGIRLTPTSAIRFAGQAVLVDFQPVTPPYKIAAIGAPDGISVAFAQSSVASRYQTLTSVDGISFSFTDSDRLDLPAGTPATLRYAKSGAAPK